MCKAIDNPISGNDTFARLYGAMNIYYNYTGKATCLDIDTDSLADTVGTDGWNWQVMSNSRLSFHSLGLLISHLCMALFAVMHRDDSSNSGKIRGEHVSSEQI